MGCVAAALPLGSSLASDRFVVACSSEIDGTLIVSLTMDPCSSAGRRFALFRARETVVDDLGTSVDASDLRCTSEDTEERLL